MAATAAAAAAATAPCNKGLGVNFHLKQQTVIIIAGCLSCQERKKKEKNNTCTHMQVQFALWQSASLSPFVNKVHNQVGVREQRLKRCCRQLETTKPSGRLALASGLAWIPQKGSTPSNNKPTVEFEDLASVALAFVALLRHELGCWIFCIKA